MASKTSYGVVDLGAANFQTVSEADENGVILTLPAAYRPAAPVVLAGLVAMEAPGDTETTVDLTIAVNGQVTPSKVVHLVTFPGGGAGTWHAADYAVSAAEPMWSMPVGQELRFYKHQGRAYL